MKCDENGERRVYYGESSRNLFIPSKEHVKLYEKGSDNSFIYKHVKTDHKEDAKDVKFQFRVERKFRKPLERQLYEAKVIEKVPQHESLNSKEEFNGLSLRKLKLSDKEKVHCKECGQEFSHVNVMKLHEEKFHVRYKCDVCPYRSFGMNDFHNHKKG